jgi:CBS domain containing-hemolysin-like protein
VIDDLQIAIPLAALCVLMSAFCSGTEVALFSLRRVDREQLAHSNLSADRRILRMLERPRRLIATVLIGNQAFNSVLAVIVLAVVMRLSPFTSMWANAGIALGITLPLIVLLSEVTSKTLAAKASLAWARAASLPLSLFAFAVTPVRIIVHYASEVLLRPLGASARTRPARDLSEEEFRTLVDAGSAQGQVDARERRLIHRVFEFNDKNVGQVMTPRERIFAVSYDLPTQRLVKELASRGFSRVPIYQKSLDNIRGIVHAKDLVRTAARKPLDRPLGDVLHEPLFVPRTTPVKRLFLTFKQKKVHMAIVVSEYGKVLGLVTMDDLLAQIFGVLRDERADLQNSIPPGRLRVRTPAAGVSSRADSNPGNEPSGPDGGHVIDPDATGPVNREDDSGPIRRSRADTPSSGPIPAVRAETGGSGPIGTRESLPMLESAPPGLRPIHPADEVTPPAVDVQDLLEGDKRN